MWQVWCDQSWTAASFPTTCPLSDSPCKPSKSQKIKSKQRNRRKSMSKQRKSPPKQRNQKKINIEAIKVWPYQARKIKMRSWKASLTNQTKLNGWNGKKQSHPEPQVLPPQSGDLLDDPEPQLGGQLSIFRTMTRRRPTTNRGQPWQRLLALSTFLGDIFVRLFVLFGRSTGTHFLSKLGNS